MIRKKIYQILKVSTKKGNLSWYFDIFIISLIILNVTAVVVQSVSWINEKYQTFFYYFEIVSVIIFTIEYLLRIWSIVEDPKFKKAFSGRIRFMFTPLALVDLLAVMPFYLPFVGIDLRFLRILRLFRLFRLFKIARYLKALKLIGKVLKDKKEELIISVVSILILLLVASTIMYYIENRTQPESFSSIPDAMWWGVSTITTVGYGDVYPITPWGKLLGGIIAILGIGLFALPTGILASGFSGNFAQHKKGSPECPHCGKQIE